MKKIGIIGSGNFGTCIARVIGNNVQSLPEFDNHVKMWVYDEPIGEKKESLVNIINTRHENVKYLPGRILPDSVEAVADITKVTEYADYLVFVIPHQFLLGTLDNMKGHVKPNAVGLSLIKGITFIDGGIELVTDTIERVLNIKCGSLMGANIANDIAAGEYCESTVAFEDPEIGKNWVYLLNTDLFSISFINDIAGQQLCGTLKNIVAIGGGIVDGLSMGQSTKAAILREGFIETYNFAKWYFPDRNVSINTMLESCGFGVIVASSYGGRNRKCAEYFVTSKKTFKECEADLLNGQKLQGTLAAEEIYKILKKRNACKMFPLFTTIYLIIQKTVPPEALINFKGKHLDLA